MKLLVKILVGLIALGSVPVSAQVRPSLPRPSIETIAPETPGRGQSLEPRTGLFGAGSELGGVLINETARVPVDGPVHHRSPPRRVQVVPATAIIPK